MAAIGPAWNFTTLEIVRYRMDDKPGDLRRSPLLLCVAASLALHIVILTVLGFGRASKHEEQPAPPLQIVLAPPQKPVVPPTPPPPVLPIPKHANPLPPSSRPHMARQTVHVEHPQAIHHKTAHPVPRPVTMPAQHKAVTPTPKRTPVPGTSSPAPMAPHPTNTAPPMTTAQNVPAPAASPAAIPAPTPPSAVPGSGGGSATPGAGAGGEGSGKGAEAGNGNGEGAGSGAPPYWPFGIDGDPGGGAPRHVVYILDVSASMESRITRARSEISTALDSLQPGETFDIVTFCETSRSFEDRLMEATPSMKRAGKQYLQNVSLCPGTNLEDALRQALNISGTNVIVLVTDGVPTVGEQNWKKLERMARRENKTGARIFSVGLVGKNPDGTDDSFEATKLLQTLSADSGGDSKIFQLGVATPQ